MTSTDTRVVVGCMTGTSLDGIDVALVEIEGKGLGMTARLMRHSSAPLGDLANDLRPLTLQRAVKPAKIARLALELGELHLSAIQGLLGGSSPDLVAIHGQTIVHSPPVSWQLINPNPVARGLGVPVVFDLRAADLAAGGQGAPITPLADYLMLRDPGETRAIVNLGGFVNITILPPSVMVEKISGGDLCACNHLLDGIARELWKEPFDSDGDHAASGIVKARSYLELSISLSAQAGAGRSLGTSDEMLDWIAEAKKKRIPRADIGRTACAAIAKAIGDATRGVDRVLLAGGGTRNRTLVEEIKGKAAAIVETTADHGMPVEAREAASMAVLGALCADREPITLSQVTGCGGTPPVAGAWVLP